MNALRQLGKSITDAKNKKLLEDKKTFHTPFGSYGPFGSSGYYVEDRLGKTFCECQDIKVARDLAAFLNKTFGPAKTADLSIPLPPGSKA
jgi:hypothetical protein